MNSKHKANNSFLRSLPLEIIILYGNKKYIEAFILQNFLMESYLKVNLFSRALNLNNTDIIKKILDEQKFSNLIFFYQLLGGNKNLSKKLTTYNDKRNQFIHRIDTFISLEDLKRHAKISYDYGEKLSNALVDQKQVLKIYSMLKSLK